MFINNKVKKRLFFIKSKMTMLKGEQILTKTDLKIILIIRKYRSCSKSKLCGELKGKKPNRINDRVENLMRLNLIAEKPTERSNRFALIINPKEKVFVADLIKKFSNKI